MSCDGALREGSSASIPTWLPEAFLSKSLTELRNKCSCLALGVNQQDLDDKKPKQVFLVAAGIAGIDQVLNVLLTTAMFVGGCVAFILDNTIPGEPWAVLSLGDCSIPWVTAAFPATEQEQEIPAFVAGSFHTRSRVLTPVLPFPWEHLESFLG